MQRVQKLLSNYGYCSRRKAEELIKEGRVKVNDKVISLGDQAEENDNLFVDDKPVTAEKKVYLLFHKPVGCVTALEDPEHETIMEYIHIKERVFPIGRLDYNTSGLIILTNDGDFANKIMHPRYEIKKTYRVALFEEMKEEDIEQLRKGVELEDGITLPAEVKVIMNTIIDITIHEGRNRIVRRMINALGYNVRTLKRTKVGEWSLGELKEGEYVSFKPE